jgi:hypothetical protein
MTPFTLNSWHYRPSKRLPLLCKEDAFFARRIVYEFRNYDDEKFLMGGAAFTYGKSTGRHWVNRQLSADRLRGLRAARSVSEWSGYARIGVGIRQEVPQ